MHLTKLKIKNYKGIRELDQDLRGNVFVVKGDNDKGKSTFAKAFLKLVTKTEKPDVPVTNGESNGQIVGEFTDSQGRKYTVVVEFTNDKETIKMVSPEGITTTKVGDIRNLFDYNYIDVDEFIAWSSTAEGRRKQREAVLKLLPAEMLVQFIEWEKKEADLYAKRTARNNVLKANESVVERFVLTDEEHLKLQTYDEAEDLYLKLKQEYDNVKEIAVELEKTKGTSLQYGEKYNFIVSELEREQSQYTALEADTLKEIEELEIKLKMKKLYLESCKKKNVETVDKLTGEIQETSAILAQYDKEYNRLQGMIKPNLKDKMEEATTALDMVKNISIKMRNYKEEKENLDKIKKEVEFLTNDIEGARIQKKEIIIKSKLPVPKLSIEEDGIFINGLPFTKEQLSTSEIMLTVFNILVALNKKTPIIYLGRAESLGKDKLESIMEVAIQNNCQLFIDKVVSGESLSIEIVEEDLDTHPLI